MLRACFAMLVCAGLAYCDDAASIVHQVAERYRTLNGYRVEGNYDASSIDGGSYSKLDAKFLIEAVEESKKLRVDYQGSNYSMTLITDGSTTWTYLPKQKIYTKVEAATSGDDENDQQPAGTNAGLTLYQVAVRAFAGLDKWSPRTQLTGEQDVKTPDGKVHCWVLLTNFGDHQQKNWVDQKNFVVWKSESELNKGLVKVKLTIKRFDTEAPGNDEFAFAPGSAKLVNELNLPGSNPVFVGRPATDFSLKNLDGQEVRLSDLRGKVVLLDFWATWCGPCRRELPTINKLAEKLKDKGVVVLGINEEDASKVRSFNTHYKYTFMTLEDNSRKVQRAYHANAIPNVFVIGRDGVVVQHFVGTREEGDLVAALHAAGV